MVGLIDQLSTTDLAGLVDHLLTESQRTSGLLFVVLVRALLEWLLWHHFEPILFGLLTTTTLLCTRICCLFFVARVCRPLLTDRCVMSLLLGRRGGGHIRFTVRFRLRITLIFRAADRCWCLTNIRCYECLNFIPQQIGEHRFGPPHLTVGSVIHNLGTDQLFGTDHQRVGIGSTLLVFRVGVLGDVLLDLGQSILGTLMPLRVGSSLWRMLGSLEVVVVHLVQCLLQRFVVVELLVVISVGQHLGIAVVLGDLVGHFGRLLGEHRLEHGRISDLSQTEQTLLIGQLLHVLGGECHGRTSCRLAHLLASLLLVFLLALLDGALSLGQCALDALLLGEVLVVLAAALAAVLAAVLAGLATRCTPLFRQLGLLVGCFGLFELAVMTPAHQKTPLEQVAELLLAEHAQILHAVSQLAVGVRITIVDFVLGTS
mmetsp:Transcript_13938/g.35610  ORF Transcript_13938/g.35610 Transcript_13938/m.35610 type:complete len:429 (-) Transcript_13938:1060-2346(-)